LSDNGSGPTFNVRSFGQTGGITAGVVYQGKPKRALLGRQIVPLIVAKLKARPIGPLTIQAYNPDAETQEFAKHFWDVATQLGWPVTSLPGTTMCPDIFHGISVQSTASAKDLDDPLRVLAEWLRSEGFSLEYVHDARENQIVVGQQQP
jgi:hypothetical protein